MIRTKLKQHSLLLLIIALGAIVTHFLFPEIDVRYNLLNSAVLFFLFFLSWEIVIFRIKDHAKRVVSNYLLMTTFRFLSFLIYVVVLIVYKVDKTAIYQVLVLCVILLIIQTIQLTKLKSKTS